MPSGSKQQHWSDGPAKWAAVSILGVAAMLGLAWSVTQRMPRSVLARESDGFELIRSDGSLPSDAVAGTPPDTRGAEATLPPRDLTAAAGETPELGADDHFIGPKPESPAPEASASGSNSSSADADPSLRDTADQHPAQAASPAPPVRPTAPPSAPTPSDGTRLINLNAATAAELELLPGIGPTLAKRIYDDRRVNGPFRSVEDLARVSGIGAKTIAKLRSVATVN